eukprot:CAMPEP_0168559344 /NCGR_PEP_ID=MMETSP0413-20121227/10470_1 /TAXON_ID=136452 /ORGANISM="Filamoeba nolandi, Strain NC-AS-23-1" /LENGTH=221 /DNA_ID=CAMNT_0008590559 /DNA_START=131 /DNA_END=796 /DNA_ORIENTATION=-
MSVMSVFQNKSIPLTIGIISNYFGQDPSITGYVQSALETDWPLNVAFHGYNHEDFSQLSYDQQYTLIVEGTEEIDATLGVIPTVFIPPYNAFNNDTLEALEANGYTTISSELALDPPPYPTSGNPPIWRWPEGAQTAELDSEYQGVTWNVTFAEIQAQLKAFGFSVVMMHPQEYSVNYDTNQVNQAQLDQLQTLLEAVEEAGIQMVLLMDLQDYFPTSFVF